MNRIRQLLISLLMCLCLSGLPVRAAEIDAASEESPSPAILIELEETEDHRNVHDVEFELYQCARLENGGFEYLDGYKNCSLQPEDLQSADALYKALDILSAAKGKPIATCTSDKNGQTLFETGECGLFLIHTSRPSGYNRIPDFLCALPVFNEENGSLEYRVKVSAKSLPLPVVQIVKTDEDGKAITSKNFAFSAYRDEECKNLRNEVAGDPKNGFARFTLDLGETIYIRETKAPEGYDLSSRIVKAELLEDGQLFIDERLQTQNALTIAVPYADRKSSPTPQPGTNPPSTNTKTPPSTLRSPQTGSQTHYRDLLLLFGAMWMLLLGLIALQRKLDRKKTQ